MSRLLFASALLKSELIFLFHTLQKNSFIRSCNHCSSIFLTMAISGYTEDYLHRPLSPSSSQVVKMTILFLKRRRRNIAICMYIQQCRDFFGYLHFISFVARSIDLVSFRLSFIFRRFICARPVKGMTGSHSLPALLILRISKNPQEGV